MIRCDLPTLFAIAFCASAVADEPADLKKRLAGTWAVTHLAVMGGKESGHSGVTWTFDGDVVIVREGGKETFRWESALTTGKELPLIDFTVTRDREPRRPFLGVLDFKADALTVMMMPVSATEADTPPFLRATVAESIGRNRSFVVTLRRQK